jgi:hypothetical protein
VGSFEPNRSGRHVSHRLQRTHPLLGADRQAAANPNYLNQPALQNTTGLQGYQQTPMTYQSVTFGSDGKIVNTDLESHVRPNNVLHDSQRHTVGIQTRTSNLARFNTGSDAPAQAGSSTMRVQMNQPTGLVKVNGFDVTPEVAETLTQAAPEAFQEPAAQQAKAKAEVATAAAEEATREDLNRHPDDQIEAAHQHFVGEVSTQNQIALMVAAHRGETPSHELLNRIASEMHEPLHVAIDKVNAISMATQAQFTVLARSMGLDADKAADWIREHRKDTAMVAAQAHGLRRDLMAWKATVGRLQGRNGRRREALMGRYINTALGQRWSDEPHPNEPSHLTYPSRGCLQSLGRIAAKVDHLVSVMDRGVAQAAPRFTDADVDEVGCMLVEGRIRLPTHARVFDPGL